MESDVDYGGAAIMNLYHPDSVKEHPAILVSLHYCTGNAQAAASWFQGLADQHGFLLIAPGLPQGDGDGCWDVGSSQTKTHDGGSHSQDIANMVAHALAEEGADPNRVFAAGASSGAMMTNVLLGAYPDVFAGGAVLAGVPFGCWTAGDGWTAECADGQVDRSGQEWGDLVRSAYPGYTGPRPKVQLFHGTGDTTLRFPNLGETVEQWTDVLGPLTDLGEEASTPKSGWTRTQYENPEGNIVMEVFIGQDAPHDLTSQNLWGEVIRFFELDQDPNSGSGGSGGGGTGGSGAGGLGAGASGAGGTASGGASSGGFASGGDSSAGGSGGVPVATGGQTATGGGGNPLPTTGGVTGLGGTVGGGQSATGGGPGDNPLPTTGGVTSAGGTTGAGGVVASPAGPGGGCSTSPGSARHGALALGLALAGFGTSFRRRRRATSRA